MRVIIVEDEALAVDKLVDILSRLDRNITVSARLSSVESAVEWISNNPEPDLGFFDIQLSDDNSFEIFRRVKVNFPIIFTTAYDNYLMEAFEQNSVHYLLKPITVDKVQQALNKLSKMEKYFTMNSIKTLLSKNGLKRRLIVRKGLDNVPVEVDDISYVFSDHKITFVCDNSGETYMTDGSLSEVEGYLDPTVFFRANRKYLVHVAAIKSYRSIENGKIRLVLDPDPSESVQIGKDRSAQFRQWIKSF